MGGRHAHRAAGQHDPDSARDLDGPLRAALREHADLVPLPGPDPMPGVNRAARHIRHRRTGSVLGSLTLIAGLGIGTTIAVHRAQNPGHEPQQLAGVLSSEAQNHAAADYLGWPNRGTPDDAFTEAARQAWADRHAVDVADVVVAPLWSGSLPSGEAAFAFQAWTRGDHVAWTVFAMRGTDSAASGATLVSDSLTPARSGGGAAVAQVSALVDTEAGPYAVVIGAPASTDVQYAADGVNFVSEYTQDGIATFAVPVPPVPPPPTAEAFAAISPKAAAAAPSAPLLLSKPLSDPPPAPPAASPTPAAQPSWAPPPTAEPVVTNPFTAAAGWHAPGVIRVLATNGTLTYQGPVGHAGPPLSAVIGASTSGWLDSSIQQYTRTGPLARPSAPPAP